MLALGIDIRRDGYEFATALKMTGIWRRAAGLLLHGDYYPLTPFSRSGERWVAWQFDRPEIGEGLLQGIRLAECADESLTVYPRVPEPDAAYILSNPETGETIELPGAALQADGFRFALAQRTGALWFYRVKR